MIFVIFALIAGFLTKLADKYSEKKERRRIIGAVYGIIYGLAIVVGGLLAPELASLIVGITIGNVFAGKIDRMEHIIALFIIMAFAIYSINSINLAILAGFAIAAFADEVMHEYSKKLKGLAGRITEMRIISPMFALGLLPITWVCFVYIVSFDVGYSIRTLYKSK